MLVRVAALSVAFCSPLLAQTERYELGKRFIRLEGVAAKHAFARERNAIKESVDKALQRFFSLDLGGAAQAIDEARQTLGHAGELPTGARFADSLYLRPERSLLDATTDSIELELGALYESGEAIPDGAELVVQLGDSASVEFPIRELPLECSVGLAGLGAGDFELRWSVRSPKRVLIERTRTLSLVDKLQPRLGQLRARAFGKSLEATTAKSLARRCQALTRAREPEIDYPGARLLAEAEAAADAADAGERYYDGSRPGEFWLRIPAGSRSVTCRVLVPDLEPDDEPPPLVLALHGAGGSENLFFEGEGGLTPRMCRERGWFLVATRSSPMGTPRLGSLLDALGERYRFDPKRVFVVGHSMGAMQATAAVRSAPDRFRAVAMLGGGGRIGRTAEVGETEFLVACGEHDFAMRGARDLHRRLQQRGANVTFKNYPGVGHVLIVLDALPATFEMFDRCAASAKSAPERPNIVLILADDLGFSDVGCYGGEIETPNLDALAENGLRFAQFYNGARCCPTRAALMTGLYAHQTGMGGMEQDRGLPGYRGNINRNCVTLAEALGAAGYATFMSGKWHLTNRRQAESDDDKFNWPRQRGFDRFFGTIAGAGSYFAPDTLTRDNEDITKTAREDETFYYTDSIAERAAQFVTEHHADGDDKPFFLYAAFTAPHWPLHAKPADIEKYRGRYDGGWDAVRAARLEKQRELGLVDAIWQLTERPKFVPPWSEFLEKQPARSVTKIDGVSKRNIGEFMANRMAIYAAMVDSMDRGIGRIVTALRDTGELDNTLLLFLSDNGGCAEWSLYGFTRGREPKIAQEGGSESYASYGGGWANASNTPFRFFKHDTHEGGICTPLIVHWPANLRDKGAWRTQIGHVIDVMPTVLAAAGAEYPRTFEGQKIAPFEGVNLLGAFEGNPVERAAPLFWEHHGNRAVRREEWKLVARGEDAPWELYHMTTDRCEVRDLSAEYPERVEELAALYSAWAVRCNVLSPSQLRARSQPERR